MGSHVVFVGAEASVFISRTSEALAERGVKVTIIDPYREKISPNKGFGAKLINFLNRGLIVYKAINELESPRVVMIHYLSIDVVQFIPILRRKSRQLIGIAYGSDILRRKTGRDWLLKLAFRALDVFAATNDNVLEEACRAFPNLQKKQRKLLRFGLPVFDALDDIAELSREDSKRAVGLPANKLTVSLGYSASPGQRQIELINFMLGCADSLEHCLLLVPVQYGNPDLKTSVLKEVAKANEQLGKELFRALTDFQDTKQAALLRRATDVLVNHSVTDAFSGTVQEVVYAGGLVLAQSGLPYQRMPGFGSSILPFRRLEDLPNLLSEESVSNSSRAIESRRTEVVAQLRAISSWDGVINDWLALIDGEKRSES